VYNIDVRQAAVVSPYIAVRKKYQLKTSFWLTFYKREIGIVGSSSQLFAMQETSKPSRSTRRTWDISSVWRLPNQETYRSMGATSYKRKSPLTCRPPFSNDAGPELSRCYGGPTGGPAVLATSRLKWSRQPCRQPF